MQYRLFISELFIPFHEEFLFDLSTTKYVLDIDLPAASR
jgi:hypothetical protein